MVKILTAVGMLTITLLGLVFVFPPRAAATPEGALTVVIDAGHGGVDGGAVGAETGVKESEVNLAVSRKLAEYFKSAGFRVVMTRTTPMGLYGTFSAGFKRRDLEKRVEIAKAADADLFISVHMNDYSSPSRRGSQVFYKLGEESKRLAAEIQLWLDKIDGDGRDGNILVGDYYVLNLSEAPAVICECGFLSSPEDEAMLITDDYQLKLAYAIFMGSVGYLTGGGHG